MKPVRPRAILSPVKTVVRLFILVVLIGLAVPVPAIQIPQTRREFVEAVAGGARSVKMDTFVENCTKLLTPLELVRPLLLTWIV